MLSLAKKRSSAPDVVLADSCYFSLKNLKAIWDHGLVWGRQDLRTNHKVNRSSLGDLEIPNEALTACLARGYGFGVRPQVCK